jgi:hypothetical protein
MGREVRRVPAGWQHPKDARGQYIPLFDSDKFDQRVARWDEEARKWSEGFRDDFNGGLVALTEKEKLMTFADWDGERPDPEHYMPLWRDEERTHLMMYEDTSEGTPVSPAFATAEELAQWLADNNASWFGNQGASYEAWRSIIDDSANSLPVFVMRNP